MSKRWTLSALALAMLGVAALGAVKLAAGQAGYAGANSERADCPGKIVCPETGRLICRDHCPTIDRNRSDCPGRIVCPITGKLVCKDRCPLDNQAAKNMDTYAKPSCCGKGK
ncbi:MAG: hypothetical protein IH989_02830 [Planctomycetes bacterium]|nr:hypothetical protein [Planctomycetota bacterium]